MGDSPGDSDSDSEPEWLRRAAHVSVVANVALRPGSTLLGGRFGVRGRIGQGGMGVVYEADDAERGERVALKTLPEHRPDAVYRIKQEFRALADVTHENLARLHGLFEDQGRWFFTMDLIEGRPLGPRSLDAVRAQLAQLAHGVEAIHRAGKLHRDLKPNNVLVTREKRVVILDFGLASDPEVGGVGQTVADGRVSGTPGYMAPEQAAGRPATAASDWYAFGVMLYESLAGRLPFEGSGHEVAARKQLEDPEPPSSHPASLPSDAELEALCMELLSRDPAARPGAALILATLAAQPSAAHPSAPHESTESGVERSPFVGRQSELEALQQAYWATAQGGPVRLFVRGPSGVGKSALVERFLEELEARGDALVLRGRCYEREVVPYNAFDRLVDELSRHVRRLPEAEALSLLPPNVHALANVFPAFGRLELLGKLRARARQSSGRALRREASLAMKDLLGRIALARPVVLYVDDLQWGDADSARVMADLLALPHPPALLVLGTYRDDEASGSAFFQLLEQLDAVDVALDRRTLSLVNLEAGDARTLASALGADTEVIDGIARESAGHPLFIQTLVRLRADGELGGVASLNDAIHRQLDALTAEARSLLRLAALHGQPLSGTTLCRAAGLSGPGAPRLEPLLERRLLRSIAGPGGRYACYHDRIREVAAAELEGEALPAAHALLADALDAARDSDPRGLVRHLFGAGRRERAVELAEREADRAFQTGALHVAVELMRLVLRLGDLRPERRGQALRTLGQALHDLQRRREAVEAFDAATPLLPLAAAAVCQAEAAFSVHLHEPLGSEAGTRASDALRRIGLHPEQVEPAMLVPLGEDAIVAEVTRVVRAGVLERMTGEALDRANTLRSVVTAQRVRPLPGLSFRHVRSILARVWLESRDPNYVAMLAAELTLPADVSERLMAEVDDPSTRSWIASLKAQRAANDGDPEAAVAHQQTAVQELESIGSSTLGMARVVLVGAWDRAAMLAEMGALHGWVRDAQERDDAGFVALTAAAVAMLLRAADKPQAAVAVLQPWLDSPHLGSARQTDLARALFVALFQAGDHAALEDACHHRLRALSPLIERSTRQRRGHAVAAVTQCLLVLAGLGDQRAKRLHEAAALIERWRQVEAECGPDAFRSSLASLEQSDRAGLAWLQGDREQTLGWLERLADERNGSVDPQLRHAALRRLGVLRQDARSARRVDAADAFFSARGVVDPERYAGSITGIFDLPPG